MKTAKPTTIAIEGISEPTIIQYFDTLNQGNFAATSRLFTPSGILQPPFDSPLIGQTAIAQYLQAEAAGMKILPCKGLTQKSENGDTEIQVSGKVQTSLFGVNISWLFILTPTHKLSLAKIKLIASPRELLNLRH
ncbi:MAG: nuclear transport factor 2 family protein [Leptolyngbyaceae cyanobacterium CSU_1_3]|nr:nuclear transport factor 2 family protein [Leptolyngbyaceae cyanobacterium CSU_1_3]